MCMTYGRKGLNPELATASFPVRGLKVSIEMQVPSRGANIYSDINYHIAIVATPLHRVQDSSRKRFNADVPPRISSLSLSPPPPSLPFIVSGLYD